MKYKIPDFTEIQVKLLIFEDYLKKKNVFLRSSYPELAENQPANEQNVKDWLKIYKFTSETNKKITD